MQNAIQHTGTQLYNGIVRLIKRFVFNSGIAVTFHNYSRSNRTGFFIAISESFYSYIAQRLQVRVYHYAVVSSLPTRSNLMNEMLKKANR